MTVRFTPEMLDEMQNLSRTVLIHGLAAGEVHPILGEPVDLDEAQVLLEKFWLDNQAELAGATVDFLFAMVRSYAFPETPIEEFTEALADCTTEQLIEIAAADSVSVELAKEALIAGRQKVVAEFKAISMIIVKGAIASAMAAALGMS